MSDTNQQQDDRYMNLEVVRFPSFYESVLYDSDQLSNSAIREEYAMHRGLDFELTDEECEALVESFAFESYKEAVCLAYVDAYLSAIQTAFPDLIQKKLSHFPELYQPATYNYDSDHLYQPVLVSQEELSKLAGLYQLSQADEHFTAEYPSFLPSVAKPFDQLDDTERSILIYYGTNQYILDNNICDEGLTMECIYDVQEKGVIDVYDYVDVGDTTLKEIKAERQEAVSSEEYILIAEDRTEVAYGDDVGDMQVVQSIDEKGEIASLSPQELSDDPQKLAQVPKGTKEQSPKKKPNLDTTYDIPLLEPFIRNFLRFSKGSGAVRLWTIPLLPQGIKASIDKLREALLDPPFHKEFIKSSRVRSQDYIERPTITPDLEEKLASVGLSKQTLEERGQLETFLSRRATDLLPLHFQVGGVDVKTEGRLSLRTQPDGSEGFTIRCVRKDLDLETPYLGCTFTEQDKQSLLETGHLGRIAQLRGTDGQAFSAYISVDEQTNSLVHVPTVRIYIPQTISGTTLSATERATLRSGQPLPFSGVSAKGNAYSATIQVDAFKRSLSFTFPTQEVEQVLSSKQNRGIPLVINGQVLSDKARAQLSKGETLYLDGLVNSRTKATFSAYVSYDASAQRMRYSKYAPTELTKQSQQREVKMLPKSEEAPAKKQTKPLKL